jgi:hypothetical protein
MRSLELLLVYDIRQDHLGAVAGIAASLPLLPEKPLAVASAEGQTTSDWLDL